MTLDALAAGQEPERQAPLARAREVLREHFGHAEFRPGQEEAVGRVLAGESFTLVMPTGAGKSACFQVPALVRGGLTLVLSPLIALMKDQVEGLQAHGIAADFVNSSVPAAEQWRRLERAAAGETRLLYVAPERLGAPSFLRAMERLPPSLLAVDEAHCISQWGHDFRPAYLAIKDFLARGARPQVLALTATATPRVRADIAEQLHLDPRRVLITGFRRPNLRLLVRRAERKVDRLDHLQRILASVPGSGIVYCATRKDVEEVSAALAAAGTSVVSYHAGMADEARASAQEAFLAGQVRVIVATNAFGMGIDKPDIRLVVHHSLPGSVEAYYQEAGRAGRDGKSAYCVLVFGAQDRFLHEFFIEGSCPDDDSVLALYADLRRAGADVQEIATDDLAERAGIPERQVAGSLRTLEDAGLVDRLDDRDNPAQVRFPRGAAEALQALPGGTQRRAVVEWLATRFAPVPGQVLLVRPGLAETDLGIPRETFLRVLRALTEDGLAETRPPFRGRGIVVRDPSLTPARAKAALAPHFATTQARRERAMERLDRICHYAYGRGCRHAYLLRYFGDEAPGRCSACDTCRGWDDPGPATPAEPHARQRKLAPAKPASARVPELDEVRPVALRAVADLRQRFGLGMATLVLRGSRSKKVLAAHLDRSDAHGSLARFRSEDVDDVLSTLVGEGLIETTSGPYPVVRLTEEGRLRLG